MIVEALSMAVIGYIAYSSYFGGTPGSVTEALNSRMDNGYQYRDITFADSMDIAHPDVKNNNFAALGGAVAQDRGMNGLERVHTQLYPGTSEILQLYRTSNLYL